MKKSDLSVILLTISLPFLLVFCGTTGIDHIQTDLHNHKVIQSVELAKADPSYTAEELLDTVTLPYQTAEERRYYDLSRAYENGEEIHFYNRKDYNAWLSYYVQTYSIDVQDETFSASFLGTDQISISQNPGSSYDRADAVDSIVTTFGIRDTEGSDREVAARTCAQVHEYLSYDSGHLTSSLPEALSDRAGVCWHYSRCLYVLLNLKGVPTRVVAGYYKGQPHAWDECLIDDTWQMIDPTMSGFVSEDEKAFYQSDSLVVESNHSISF